MFLISVIECFSYPTIPE